MPQITDSIGRVLGKRYRLVSALGAGASAHVFLAEDVTLQRHVAVKVLQPALVSDEAFLKRFRAEARSVASLNHPHVLRVFDWGEDPDGPYLVLEYLGGGTLRELLDQGVRLTPSQAALLGTEVAQGLSYAHVRGLVHRDVKPANLLFDEEGRVRVADFGVARALAEAAWTEPAGAMVGTARYASPEQAEGKAVDGRADVYSLALVLYESLTGVVPFVTDTTVGTLMARVGKSLPGHDGLGPLGEVLTWAAAPDVEDRLDAAALATRLHSIAAELPAPEPLPLRHAPPPIDPNWGEAAVAAGNASTTVAGVSTEAAETTAINIAGTSATKAGPGQVFDAEAVEGPHATRWDKPPGPPPAIARREHKKRWPWVVGALAVLLVIGLIVYAIEAQVFTPSKPVPTLSGLTVAQAEQAIKPGKFTLSVAGAVYSKSVKALEIATQDPSARSSAKEGSTITVHPSKGPPPTQIHTLAGLTCAGAQAVLTLQHFTGLCPDTAQLYSSTIPAGQVVSWSYNNIPDPKVAPYGSAIMIAISKGHTPVVVPNVAGQTPSAAASALQAAGFQTAQGQGYSTQYPAGQVMGTTPAIGQAAPFGSTVTIIVSQGPPSVAVPNVFGLSVADATTALQSVGLKVGKVHGPQAGHIYATSPSIGSTQLVGTAIDLDTVV